ncbi:MAG: adenylate/guanylate cyclase domain-containing protein [Alphaproteobacteria bacterium]|jgi:adenylate cyclase|nr:adenylate/guanylate cyclase domain-containing protein [Alphaproteobacteria bacterium]MDP6516085.1 adenylate/guanylate cyclase domain-containing protein [Alphaproteobacteria bacterium]
MNRIIGILRIFRFIKAIHLVGLVILVSLWGLRQWNPAPLETLQLKTFDFYQNLRPRENKKTPIPVAIIDLDEKSLAKFGQWPWPRTLLAELVDKLVAYRVAVVGFDSFFPEYDRMSPTLMADNLRGLEPGIVEQIRAQPRTEAAFAKALSQARVVLGQGTLESPRDWGGTIPRKANFAELGGDPRPNMPAFPAVLRNVPELEGAAVGLGMVSLSPEVDGVVRRVNMALRVDKEIFPTLTLDMLRVLAGQKNIVLKIDSKNRTQSVLVPKVGAIPTDERFRTWVHFRPTDKAMYVSAGDVLDGTVPPERLQNALALVGTSALGLKDIRNTPINQNLPGVEVHAQLLEMVMTQSFLRRPPWVQEAEVFAVVVMGLLMIVLVPLLGATLTLLFVVVIIGGLVGGSWYSYAENGMLVDAVYPSLSGLAMYMSLTYMNYIREEAQKKQVRGAFSMYMSPALVEKLAKEPDLLRLGGEMKDMSLLFADIRGFTTISETYKDDPEDLTNFINKFLTPMTGVILEREGTIDKYMGDCIMAFWNAPLDDEAHAAHACESALKMLGACSDVGVTVKADAEERASKAREDLAAAEARIEGGDETAEADVTEAKRQLALAEKETKLEVKIGIGVNTDVVCVGNMGSDQRFDYSVLGDGVNLAARLEGQSKTYGTTVVIGEGAQRQAPQYATIELDRIQVKGKLEPVTIFGLLGDPEMAQTDTFKQFAARHAEMLAAYRRESWDQSEALSKECREACGPWGIEGLYDLFDERIQDYRENPPPADVRDENGVWNGVFVATSK